MPRCEVLSKGIGMWIPTLESSLWGFDEPMEQRVAHYMAGLRSAIRYNLTHLHLPDLDVVYSHAHRSENNLKQLAYSVDKRSRQSETNKAPPEPRQTSMGSQTNS